MWKHFVIGPVTGLAVGRGILAFLAGCMMLGLVGCQTTGGLGKSSAQASNEFSLPYLYKGPGVGAQPVLGFLQLKKGEEAKLVSRALLESIQSLEMSIVNPPASLDQLIIPEQEWETDIVSLPRSIIEEHNHLSPDHALPLDRRYSIQYKGKYSIDEKIFVFRIESHLFHGGLASNFRPYNKSDYSGNYFFNRMKSLLQDRMEALAGETN